MALIVSGISRCPLCDKTVNTDIEDIFATRGVFIEPENNLSRFCDAAMHWECYEKWEYREAFAKKYFDAHVDSEKCNPYWAKVFLNEDVFITVNPAEPVSEVDIVLMHTGSGIRVKMEKWEDWIFGGYCKKKEMRDIEKKIIEKNFKEIRKQCGKVVDLKKNIDWDAKKKLAKEIMEAEKNEEDKRNQKIKEANLKTIMLNKKLKMSGLICPHCNELTRNIRFIEGELTRKSVFICKDCGRSFFSEKETK